MVSWKPGITLDPWTLGIGCIAKGVTNLRAISPVYRPRVVGFFDCVAQSEVMQVQGPYCSISAFDRGDDYDECAMTMVRVRVRVAMTMTSAPPTPNP